MPRPPQTDLISLLSQHCARGWKLEGCCPWAPQNPACVCLDLRPREGQALLPPAQPREPLTVQSQTDSHLLCTNEHTHTHSQDKHFTRTQDKHVVQQQSHVTRSQDVQSHLIVHDPESHATTYPFKNYVINTRHPATPATIPSHIPVQNLVCVLVQLCAAEGDTAGFFPEPR